MAYKMSVQNRTFNGYKIVWDGEGIYLFDGKTRTYNKIEDFETVKEAMKKGHQPHYLVIEDTSI